MNDDMSISNLETLGIEILSKEEFKRVIDQATPTGVTIKELVIDNFDRLPSYVKSLKNFDPFGVAAYIADTIAEEKAKLDDERDFEIKYQFYIGMRIIDSKLKVIDETTKKKIPLLTDAYSHYSSQIIYKELIIAFRNIWCNSIFNGQDDLKEQLKMFDLLASLTTDQIKILKKMDYAFKSEFRETLKPDQKGVQWVNNIASDLGIEKEYTQMLCLGLVAKGLLKDASAANPSMGIAAAFRIGDYFNKFLKYVMSP